MVQERWRSEKIKIDNVILRDGLQAIQESKQENTSTDNAMRKLWAGVDPIGIKQDSWDITREERSK